MANLTLNQKIRLNMRKNDSYYFYNYKIINMNKYVQIIKYKVKYIACGQFEGKVYNYINNKKDGVRFDESILRTRRNLRNLCMANYSGNDSFLTLTFKDNIVDVKSANKDFDLFRRKLKRYLKKNFNLDLKYIAVIEFQKRGAVHYHCILFDVPKINYQDIYKMWSNGWIYIKKINNDRMMLNYISKYIIKSVKVDNMKFKKNEKIYDRSRNLKSPEIIQCNDFDFDSSLLNDADLVYQFENDEVLIGLYTNLNMDKFYDDDFFFTQSKNVKRSKFKKVL